MNTNGVKKIRKLLGMSQAKFANAIGTVSPGAISNYETGLRTPKPCVACKIIALASKKGIKANLEDIYNNR